MPCRREASHPAGEPAGVVERHEPGDRCTHVC